MRSRKESSRRRSTIYVALLVLLSTTAVFSQSPTPTPANADAEVKISTNLIQLDVTVVDSRGRVVRDVRADEIEIYENGKKQAITNFSLISSGKVTSEAAVKENKPSPDRFSVPVPQKTPSPEQVRRTIVLVVDDFTLSFESVYYVRRALRRFVDDQMQEGDLVAIIRTGAGIGALQQFTSDKAVLHSAIERVRHNPLGTGGLGALATIEPSFSDRVAADGSPQGQGEPGNNANSEKANADFQTDRIVSGTIGALRFIVEGMADLPGRKSAILFTDGFRILTQDEHGFTQSGATIENLRRLVDDASRSSVVFYTVDARGIQYNGPTAADQQTTSSATGGTALPSPRVYSRILTNRGNEIFFMREGPAFIAKETGGLMFADTNDLTSGVTRALEDQSYYLIGYEPDSDTFDADKQKFNTIEVKVTRPGLSARHSGGFYNVPDEKRSAASENAAAPGVKLAKSLMSPFAENDIALRMSALFGSDPSGSYVRSLLHIRAEDLKFTDVPGGSKKAVFDVWAASFGDNGTPVDQIRKTYTLEVKAEGFKRIQDEGFVYFFLMPVKKPGGYQYRVAIRDTQNGSVGSASQFIQIPDVKKGALATSSVLIESLSSEEWAKLIDPNGGSVRSTSQTDTALRRIKLGTVLRYGVEVYNAKLDSSRKPALQTRLRMFRDGQLVLDGKPVPVDLTGQTDMRGVAVNGAINILNTMQPGDYILQVIVTDTLAKEGRQVAARHVQFEIVQ